MSRDWSCTHFVDVSGFDTYEARMPATLELEVDYYTTRPVQHRDVFVANRPKLRRWVRNNWALMLAAIDQTCIAENDRASRIGKIRSHQWQRQ